MSLGPSVIVLFCILGAAALVVTGAAIARFFVADDASPPTVQDDQLAHMRQVRMRNVMWAEREARRGHGRGRDSRVFIGAKDKSGIFEPIPQKNRQALSDK
ncbi:MAG: hypothetical protein ASARMPRED_003898 [Alectoria sarmentosa]|nr:MAG: hypothetical protein ASARMPRED_003898 [Alectoria sarmentosa]